MSDAWGCHPASVRYVIGTREPCWECDGMGVVGQYHRLCSTCLGYGYQDVYRDTSPPAGGRAGTCPAAPAGDEKKETAQVRGGLRH